MHFVLSSFRTAFLFNLTILSLIFSALTIAPAQAIETDFLITVKARDGGFIGTSMGGAFIEIVDRRTGDIIASGATSGASGDIEKIINTPKNRRDTIYAKGDSAIAFSLDLFEPTPVTITATGPLIKKQNQVSVSEDLILIPGKDYSSQNGILLELPGFVVDVVHPPLHHTITFDKDKPITLVSNILKLSGNTLSNEGLWNYEDYEIEAHIYKDTLLLNSFALNYLNSAGNFGKKFKLPAPGIYTIMVSAYDPYTKEAGIDSTTVVLKAE